MQNVFWTSTASRQRRNESSAAGPRSCSSAHASASRARSSYGTRQTSPTRLGSKWGGSGSSLRLMLESSQRATIRGREGRALLASAGVLTHDRAELRPLVTAIPVQESGTLVFAVGERAIRV